VGGFIDEVEKLHPGLERPRLIHETVRRLIDHMVNDLIAETRRRLDALGPGSVEEIRRHERPVAAFNDEMLAHDRALREFLFEHMYRHPRVNRMTDRARRVVRALFELYLAEPRHLPEEWRRLQAGAEAKAAARVVADYIAGMTDRYALEEHRRLVGGDAAGP